MCLCELRCGSHAPDMQHSSEHVHAYVCAWTCVLACPSHETYMRRVRLLLRGAASRTPDVAYLYAARCTLHTNPGVIGGLKWVFCCQVCAIYRERLPCAPRGADRGAVRRNRVSCCMSCSWRDRASGVGCPCRSTLRSRSVGHADFPFMLRCLMCVCSATCVVF